MRKEDLAGRMQLGFKEMDTAPLIIW